MKKLDLKTPVGKIGEVLKRDQMKKILGGYGGSRICDNWRSNPETCYNCCISVNSWDYCASVC